MKGKLVTIVVLPHAQAHILKMQLEEKGIECDLEMIDLLEGSSTSTVRVKILEKELNNAIPVLDDFLGKRTIIPPRQKPVNERHILVPVDFSGNSEKACIMAFNIASHLNSKLVFLHSFINPLIHSIPFSDVYAYDSALLTKVEYAENNANENFKRFISQVADKIGKEKWDKVPSEFVIKSGYADEDILAYAHENQSRLIVIGSSGKSGETDTVGSVTVDVMYNASVPVLVVPDSTPAKELSEFRNVLYATNFDEKDFVVIDKLMTLLQPFNINLLCAHVGQPKGDGWDVARLNGMKDILKEKYRSESFDCRLIVGSNTLEALEHFIEVEKIDIISLTTHKRNMISRLFNPSFAKKMTFHAHTPLLVFHA